MENSQGLAPFGIGFLIGFIVGFFVRHLFLDNKGSWFVKLEAVDSGRTLLLIIISTIWILTVLTEILNPLYKVNPLIHGIMGTVCGFFFLVKGKDQK